MADLPATSDPLDRAILDLLDRLPLRWEPVDTDLLTGTEQEALKKLTAAGLVDRRFTLRLSLAGHAVSIEATITFTGEEGLAQAVEPLMTAAWTQWAAEYQNPRGGTVGPRPTARCERTGPELMRLTSHGETARADVRSGDAATVLDFVRRRGPAVFAFRPPVTGDGRAEAIRTVTAPANGPLDVKVTNLGEVSGPLASLVGLLGKLFEARGAGEAAASGRAAPAPDDAETTPAVQAAPEAAYRFSFEPGGHWLVRYDGRKVGLFPDEFGFRYIQALLVEQGRNVAAVTLRDGCRRRPAWKRTAGDAEAAEEELGRLMGSGEMTDKKTVARVLRAQDELKARLGSCADEDERDGILDRLARIGRYLREVTDSRGLVRPTPGDPRKKAADAVRSAIRTAVRKIKDADNACGLHLMKNIDCGANPKYAPSPSVAWQFS